MGPDISFLRKRAEKYRRLANEAKDPDIAASYRLIAEIDEQEAERIEKQRVSASQAEQR
jgi:hypothetical protein